ncbi:hypothetical protein V1511DRAFT_506565 [Dipodascopsis uninucleata]
MTDALFTPIKVGNIEVSNRIVLAPLTRLRNQDDYTPTRDLLVPYYSERAEYPGSLLIAEGTIVDSELTGYDNAPGIFTAKQIDGWKPVTKAVHDKKSFFFCQLFGLGRVNYSVNPVERRGPSAIACSGQPVPRELTIAEIKEIQDSFTEAAVNAINAGFDGVEIHAANGYLLDQFLQDVSNQRTDEYGGSVENRARMLLETVDKVCAAIGDKKVGVRFSPFSEFQDMKMKDPYPQFKYTTSKLQETHPELAYLHFIEPRVSGAAEKEIGEGESLEPFIELWKGPIISAGGFNPARAVEFVEKHPNGLVAFGRYYISNPDLVAKIRLGLDFTPYDRGTFYLKKDAHGYLGYPIAKQSRALIDELTKS